MSQIKMDEADLDRRIAAAKASRALAEEREQAEAAGPQAPPTLDLLYSPAMEHNPGAPAHVAASYAAQIRPVNEPRVTPSPFAQEIRMPDTSTEPTPYNSVKVGTLVVFHSDDGGFTVDSRNQVHVMDADGKRLKDSGQAMWRLFQELRQLAEAARGRK